VSDLDELRERYENASLAPEDQSMKAIPYIEALEAEVERLKEHPSSILTCAACQKKAVALNMRLQDAVERLCPASTGCGGMCMDCSYVLNPGSWTERGGA